MVFKSDQFVFDTQVQHNYQTSNEESISSANEATEQNVFEMEAGHNPLDGNKVTDAQIKIVDVAINTSHRVIFCDITINK